MMIGILQPGYLPWLGFFEQVYRTDIFVIYDDVTFDKGGWRNRNRVKTPQGWCWLTVPVIKEKLMTTLIREVKICYKSDWRKKHLATLQQNYRRAPHYADINPIIEKAYGMSWERLIDLDMYFIEEFMRYLGIERKLFFSSALGIEGDRNTRLIKICRHFGAERFYEGEAGQSYMDVALFQKNGIEVIFQDYQHPVYSQVNGNFVPYLSTIDLLFNHGRESNEIIISQRK
jgi:hypothetical protein